MVVTLSQTWDWCVRNRLWLASLAGGAALNAVFILLASLAPVGHLPPMPQREIAAAPIEIVVHRRALPPPSLDALAAEAPPTLLPPRFQPRMSLRQTLPGGAPQLALPQLRLNLNPCTPEDERRAAAPECVAEREWLRADRDAAELLGPNAQGYTLDEVAVARGWIKPKPRSGQDAMAATTDATLPEQIFKDAPFPPHAIERSGGW
jgi:hypothetical protein